MIHYFIWLGLIICHGNKITKSQREGQVILNLFAMTSKLQFLQPFYPQLYEVIPKVIRK
jgi:hypothetical protein